jgi:hypothetical protein
MLKNAKYDSDKRGRNAIGGRAFMNEVTILLDQNTDPELIL